MYQLLDRSASSHCQQIIVSLGSGFSKCPRCNRLQHVGIKALSAHEEAFVNCKVVHMVNIQADTDEASESDMETSNDKDIETIVKVSKI